MAFSDLTLQNLQTQDHAGEDPASPSSNRPLPSHDCDRPP